MLSNHNELKWKLLTEIQLENPPKFLETKQQILNNTRVKEKISREIFKYFKLNKNINATY